VLMKNGAKDACCRCPVCGSSISMSCRSNGTCVKQCVSCGWEKTDGSYRANQEIKHKILRAS